MSEFKQRCGSRLDVYEGIAHHTKGGLTKDDLIFCEQTGRVKSKKAIARGHFLINSLRNSASPAQAAQIEQSATPVVEAAPATPIVKAIIPKKSKKINQAPVSDKLPE